MTYVDGFVIAVPIANRDAYRDHAQNAVPLFKECGATRMVENWGDDVPDGKVNDLKQAVQAKPDETVVFSWIEYPDRAARDAAGAKYMSDPRMEAMGASMPFDGSRLIFGGFQAEVDDGSGGAMGYVDGFVLPVPHDKREVYFDFARKASEVFRDHGAIRVVEAWGDDVRAGKVTDFVRAAHATGDEAVVFSWIEWPDKATRDTGMAATMSDERMKIPPDGMPFDGKRMTFGGFETILDA